MRKLANPAVRQQRPCNLDSASDDHASAETRVRVRMDDSFRENVHVLVDVTRVHARSRVLHATHRGSGSMVKH
jgi:hypothetical protein